MIWVIFVLETNPGFLLNGDGLFSVLSDKAGYLNLLFLDSALFLLRVEDDLFVEFPYYEFASLELVFNNGGRLF